MTSNQATHQDQNLEKKEVTEKIKTTSKGNIALTMQLLSQVIRIIMLTILFIILFSGLLLVVTGSKDQVYPNHAYDNTGDYGQSLLKKHLQKNYQLIENRVSLDMLKYDKDSVILIINPIVEYSKTELQHLYELYQQHQNIIILGANQPTINILNYFGVYLDTHHLYDYTNNAGLPIYLKTANKNDNITLFKPLEILGSDIPYRSLVSTMPTVVREIDASWNFTVKEELPVIGKLKTTSLVFGSDGWLLTNFMLRSFPDNIKAIDKILLQFPNVTKIVLEESGYAWYPTSRSSAKNFLYSFYYRKQNVIFSILWILFPLFSGIYLVLNKSMKRTEKTDHNISKRLQDLYLNKYEVYPLTMEEKFLMNYNNLQGIQRKTFLMYLARTIKEEFIQRGFYKHLPDTLKQDLDKVSTKYYGEPVTWRVIENSIIAFKLFLEYPLQEVHKKLQDIVTQNMNEYPNEKYIIKKNDPYSNA